jgi:hypothetical protein
MTANPKTSEQNSAVNAQNLKAFCSSEERRLPTGKLHGRNKPNQSRRE